MEANDCESPLQGKAWESKDIWKQEHFKCPGTEDRPQPDTHGESNGKAILRMRVYTCVLHAHVFCLMRQLA